MLMEKNGKAYKSPRGKLLQFFESSRDKWRIKCLASKRLIKRLKNRVHFLETSKEGWKERARALEGEVEELKKKLEIKRRKQRI
jgi:hypothetical protein